MASNSDTVGSDDDPRHPSAAVLLGHVAGTLALAHHLVVATHVVRCQECSASINLLERIGGTILADGPIAGRPPGILDRCMASITAEEGREACIAIPPVPVLRPTTMLGGINLPRALAGLQPTRLRSLAPGLQHSILWRDDRSTLHFIKVRAGVSLPSHRHRGLELTCVLRGAFRDNQGRYDVGDVTEQEANDDQGDDHVVTAEPAEDCICIMATNSRLKFSGWLARLLQPVMPF